MQSYKLGGLWWGEEHSVVTMPIAMTTWQTYVIFQFLSSSASPVPVMRGKVKSMSGSKSDRWSKRHLFSINSSTFQFFYNIPSYDPGDFQGYSPDHFVTITSQSDQQNIHPGTSEKSYKM